MEIGKLYKCSKCYLLIYPSIEKAAATAAAATGWSAWTTWLGGDRRRAVAYWSKKANCKVRFSELEEVFMCLKQEGKYVHALFGEKQGWIINKKWLKIERIK